MTRLWEGAPVAGIAEAHIIPLRQFAVLFFVICLGLFFWAEWWIASSASIFSALLFVSKFKSFGNHAKKYSKSKYVYTGDAMIIFSIDEKILDSYTLDLNSRLIVRQANADEYISIEWLPEVIVKGGVATPAEGFLYIEPKNAYALIALLSERGIRLKFVG